MTNKNTEKKDFLKIAGNIYLAKYVAAANTLGIEYEIIVHRLIAKFTHNKKHWFIVNTVVPINNAPSCTIAKRKHLTHLVLSKANLPLPKQAKIKTAKDAINFFHNEKDIVLKPAQALGGHGVSILPHNVKEVTEAFSSAYKHSKSKKKIKVLAEEFIHGDHYRFLVLDDKVIAVIQRIPATITGDGQNTVQELVKIENIARRKKHFKPIPTDEQFVKKLSSLDLKPNSIPPKDVTVEVRFHANLTAGGTARECMSEIAQYYKDIAIQATKVIGLKLSGVDIITPDITKKVKCAINEVNYNPGIRVHYNPDEGEPVDVAVPIMKYCCEHI